MTRTTKTQTKKMTPAERALFKLQFGIQMFNCGRDEMGSVSLTEAQEILQDMIKEEQA